MKFKMATALNCILAMGLGSWSLSAPRIELSESEVRLGSIHSGRPMRHFITVGNAGSQELNIHSIQACCGTSFNPSNGVTLPVGEELPLEIAFYVPHRAGRHVRLVDIDSDCPEQPRVSVRISFQAVSVADIEPRYVFFGRVERDESSRLEVEITTKDGMRIEGASLSCAQYSAELQTIESGRLYSVSVFTNTPLDFGGHSAMLCLDTDMGSRLEVPVFATVMGPLTYAPTQIVLPADREDSINRQVIVRAGTSESFKILGVGCPGTEMSAEVSPFGDDGYRVDITNIVSRSELDGREISIRTDVEGMERITIPISLLK